jgi:hypothetical protein
MATNTGYLNDVKYTNTSLPFYWVREFVGRIPVVFS